MTDEELDKLERMAEATTTGPRSGPRVETSLSCFGCVHEHSESYRVQGDSGCRVSCKHPAANEGALRRIGDTHWDTPGWCPLKPPTQSELIAEVRRLRGKLCGLDTMDEQFARLADKAIAERDEARRIARVMWTAGVSDSHLGEEMARNGDDPDWLVKP